jgi:hypothetical protein
MKFFSQIYIVIMSKFSIYLFISITQNIEEANQTLQKKMTLEAV